MSASPALVVLVSRVLAAPIALFAVALLVRGADTVGDGFSAGTVAALGVILHGLAEGPAAQSLWVVRRAPEIAVAGLLGALAVAAAPLAFGDPLLTHAPAPGTEPVKIGTLKLASAIAFDLAIALIVLGTVVALIAALAEASRDRPAGPDGDGADEDAGDGTRSRAAGGGSAGARA